jgi:hypothetical protein
MFRKHRVLVLIFVGLALVSANNASAQSRNVRDSIITTGFFAASYGYFIPGGDLAERFGDNSTIGAFGGYKSKRNHFITGEWNYIFGYQVKENGILDSIKTSGGFVIDQEGKMADLRIFERGFTAHVQFGHLFPINGISPNKNSGILLTCGIGMLQHKIRIYDNGGRSPQLTGEYLKGYDRLTSGVSFSQFIGYWYMSNSRYFNAYFGFEAYQGITKSRRSWDYDLMRADTRIRTDLLYGARVGFVIPIYRRGRGEYI